jgi:predicted nucleotidyltransferase
MSTKDNVHQFVMNYKAEMNRFGVSRLGLFGSVVRGEDTDASDIDILVEFVPGGKNYDNYIDLCYFLEDHLGRNVDLLTLEGISRIVRENIQNEIEYVEVAS